MDLKIDFVAKDNGHNTKSLHASIKYIDVVEDVSLNKTVTDEDLRDASSDIQSFIKAVRKALQDTVSNLKNNNETVTAAKIKSKFLENNKALLS